MYLLKIRTFLKKNYFKVLHYIDDFGIVQEF